MERRQKLVLVGNAIRQARKERGLKQKQLADLCKIEKASISRIEAGKTNVTVLTLFHIANALGINVAEFFKL